MKILGIETSCDETAVAIVDGRRILSSVVASQSDIHAKYGGVVPEIASRRHVEVIVPLLREAVERSGCALGDIEGVAVTRAPGLIGALLAGLSVAKAISYGLDIPLIGVNHLEGHINAIHLSAADVPYPHIGLIVSGGHTSIYKVEAFGRYRLLGATRDDAAGEAFDKVARLLGLGYPGGPAIEKWSEGAQAARFKKPKFTDCAEFDFSFSGIKTAVMLCHRKLEGAPEAETRKIAAGFQEAVVGMLVTNVVKAAKKHGCGSVVVAGGVAANRRLREALNDAGGENMLRILIPPMELCTDNAAMIAYVGGRRLEENLPAMRAPHSEARQAGHDMNAEAVEEIGI